ncbi:DUF6882 domain-containing protein, partial [Nocardiopsis sp. RV163]|uniref:DUF6882 domain-containing protein n=1 Tax=Nocardiopsis sp. RV163 TaxID=1661388 RepID=UPI00373FDE9E
MAQPHLAWVVEQTAFFDETVPFDQFQVDLAQEAAWRGGRRLRVGLLGSYAEDGTWLWGWANPAFEGRPVVTDALRLRETGERHAVPELAEGLVDLNHLPDPRLASDHMSLIAMGLLGTRGGIVFNHAGRARTFLTVTDPGIPWAPPRMNCSLEVGLEIQFHRPGSSPMRASSSLTPSQRERAIAWFEQG